MTNGYRKSLTVWQVVLLVLLGFYQACLGHPFAGGDGTAAKPYRIATAAQLRAIGSSAGYLDKHYVLIKDIDLKAVGTGPQYGPYVTSQTFEGWLDGKGYVIKGLHIEGPFGQGRLGLFGRIGKSAVILDLHLEDGLIDYTASDEVGLLAGMSEGRIIGCSASGKVSGKSSVGLLVGSQSAGAILYCYVQGVVEGASSVGGMVGKVTEARIVGCRADGNLIGGSSCCGGLVGSLEGGSVEDCLANTEIYAPGGDSVGGLVGCVTSGTVSSSLSLGQVKGNSYVGGLVGQNWGQVRSCYSLCSVHAQQDGAGLVAVNKGGILFCYAAGPVSARQPSGLVGRGNGAFLSYWDMDATGVKTSAAGLGRTTEQLRQGKTFKGWGYDGVWIMPAGSRPRLWWEHCWGPALVDPPISLAGGSGTPGDPYLIANAEQFLDIPYRFELLDKQLALSSDIDLQATDPNTFIPIGVSGVPFCGTFDGTGHTIRGLRYMSSGNYGGLFGCVGVDQQDPNRIGRIKDLIIADTYVQAGDVIGALVGLLDGGKVSGCIVSGQVQGQDKVGGLAGEVIEGWIYDSGFSGVVKGNSYVGGLAGSLTGQVRGCMSAGQVTGSGFNVGGLIGEVGSPFSRPYSAKPWSTISYCYSEASVTGPSSVGGLISSGRDAEIFACYSVGKVSGTLKGGLCYSGPYNLIGWGNFWDYQASGVKTSAIGQPVSTQDMCKASTFAGWGYGGYWTINEGLDRPRLVWEGRVGSPLRDPPRRYGGGRGSSSDPYLIGLAEDILVLGQYPEDWSRHIRLVADIDLGPVTSRLQPIGTPLVPFTGSFDGNHHKIRNLRLNRPHEAYVGLFRHIARPTGHGQLMTGLVSNLTLESVQVSGCFQVGAIAGLNGGTIMYCTVDGSVSADGSLGGLVGRNLPDALLLCCQTRCNLYFGGINHPKGMFMSAGGLTGINEGSIVCCSYDGRIFGKKDPPGAIKPQSLSEFIGGLVGKNLDGMILGCTARGYVTGATTVAGLVGQNIGGWIYRCGAMVDVDAALMEGAGFVASSTGGSIIACFARGQVKGWSLGGFIAISQDDQIESCYFRGALDGYSIGGFIKWADGSIIRHCYSSARIEYIPKAGGFAWELYPSVRVLACFWDKTLFPEERNLQGLWPDQAAQIVGVEAEALQACQVLKDAGWDLGATWVQQEGNYPRLWWE